MPLLGRRVAEKAHHLMGKRRVEAGDGLVREDHPRLLRERAGNGDALLLAAGETIRALLRFVQQLDAIKADERALAVRAGEIAEARRATATSARADRR